MSLSGGGIWDTARVLKIRPKIERKHLTLYTRIKRLARKMICFSKSVEMHDIIMGLCVNRNEFGLPV